MITPVIDGAAELAAKLDLIPQAIRAALEPESGQLGRARHRFRPSIHRTAGVPPALRAAIAAAIREVLHR